MKNGEKVSASVLSVFLCGLFCLTLSAADDFVDPYSFDHTHYTKTIPEAIDDFSALPFPLNIEINPVVSGKPSIIKDSEGNTRIYLAGKLIMMTEKNGDTTFFSSGQKYFKVNVNRKLIDTYGWNNKGVCTIRNNLGEITSYEQYRFGGKISSRFDSHMNLTNVYFYDDRGTGYWNYNVITQEWNRVELGKAKETRSISKDGMINSYWKEEDGCLWEIKMTAMIIYDEQGLPVLGEDGEVLTRIVEGDRIRYNGKDQSQPMEVYDFEGNLEISYVWENYHLKKVTDYEHGTYQKYGEFQNQIIEEGVIGDDGEEIITWEHVWQGNRHLAAYEYMLNPLSGSPVRSGKYITYTVEDNVDEVRLAVSDTNITWVSGLSETSGAPAPEIGDDILLVDYVYFYEISNLGETELGAVFGASDDDSMSLYNVSEEYKNNDKALAGLFSKVIYGMGNNKVMFFNEFNQQELVWSIDDKEFVDIEACLFRVQARNYLECGDYEAALKVCNEFETVYKKEAEKKGPDTALGQLYLKVLGIKTQALEKIGSYDQV